MQFLGNANLFAAPVWIAGLIAFFARSPLPNAGLDVCGSRSDLRSDRGRFYYVAEAYPVLLAMGSVVSERWLSCMSKAVRRTLAGVYFACVAAWRSVPLGLGRSHRLQRAAARLRAQE